MFRTLLLLIALSPLAVHAQTPPDVAAARTNAEQNQQVEQRRDAQQREATVAAPVVRSTAPAAGEYPVLPSPSRSVHSRISSVGPGQPR